MTRHPTTIALALLALTASALFVQQPGHAQVSAGAFASVPVFDMRGTALAVFLGGTVADLEAGAQQQGATGVWAQDATGGYQLLVVSGPTFLKAPFLAAFPQGVKSTAVTLVRPAGATPPPPTSTPVPSATPITNPAPNVTPTLGTATASLLLDLTNQQRVANGLGSLKFNAQLTAAATAYANVVMQQDPYLNNVAGAHTLDGQPADRATRAGYVWSSVGENVAVASDGGQQTAPVLSKLMIDGWMNSAGHRANILTAGFVDTGVGCATGTAANPVASKGANVFICVSLYGTPK